MVINNAKSRTCISKLCSDNTPLTGRRLDRNIQLKKLLSGEDPIGHKHYQKSSFWKTKIYSIRAVNLVDAKRFSCLYKNEES
jgi:hypothetical protein